MKAVGTYDGDLQMFVQEPRPIQLHWLGFLRWLGERGLLEHEIAGKPAGPLADTEINHTGQAA